MKSNFLQSVFFRFFTRALLTSKSNISPSLYNPSSDANACINITYFRQENEYYCGPAIVQMLVPEAGQNALAYLLKTNPVTGTSHIEIKEMLEIFGFYCKENFGVEPLLASNGNGFVNLICYIEPEEQEGHFAFIKEMDMDTVTLIDPYYGENHRIARSYFMDNWRGESTPKNWSLQISAKNN